MPRSGPEKGVRRIQHTETGSAVLTGSSRRLQELTGMPVCDLSKTAILRQRLREAM